MSGIRHVCTSPKLCDRTQVSVLRQFDDKNKFARKRNKGRDVSYEFLRLPKNIQAELDRVIAETLKKYLA
ncbi:ParB family protein [Photobacterium carnosum]|uniref:ParB family protein n=1 Tax=Photobacterium carnosum TaxID=2023717 RepID=UPI002D7F9F5B|nr:ParB family protein [Photobacterium carnosum]